MSSLHAILPWAEVILGILLITAILFQQSEAGLGSAFGAQSMSGSFHTKRGAEKNLFIATIVLAVLFLLTALLTWLLA